MTELASLKPGSPEWLARLDEDDITDMFFFAGDEIAEELGLERNEDGDWSEAAAEAILAECRKRVNDINA